MNNKNSAMNNKMKGLSNDEIIARFSGLLYWKWWAGIHRLYHGNNNNNNNNNSNDNTLLIIIRDYIAPLLQIYSIFHLINLLLPFTLYEYNLGYILVGILIPIYLSTDLVIGGLFLHLLYNINKYSTSLITDHMIWDVFVCIIGLLSPPFFSWVIGPHHFISKDYCVIATKPRVSLLAWLLNPYFHFMELILKFGYSPTLQNDIRTFTLLALQNEQKNKKDENKKNK